MMSSLTRRFLKDVFFNKLNFSGFSGKVGLYSGGLGGQNSTLVRSFEFSVGEICVGATLRFYTVRPKIVLEPREVNF